MLLERSGWSRRVMRLRELAKYISVDKFKDFELGRQYATSVVKNSFRFLDLVILFLGMYPKGIMMDAHSHPARQGLQQGKIRNSLRLHQGDGLSKLQCNEIIFRHFKLCCGIVSIRIYVHYVYSSTPFLLKNTLYVYTFIERRLEVFIPNWYVCGWGYKKCFILPP